MAHVNEANRLRIQDAIAHLEQNPACEIVQKGSSEFYQGDRAPNTHCDRFLVKLGRYMGKPVFCRVVFDSNDYGLPPDILVDTTRVLPDMHITSEAFLPHTWDLNDRRCLTNWMQHVHGLVNDTNNTPASSFHTREYEAWATSPSAPTETEILADFASNTTEQLDDTSIIEKMTDVSSPSSFPVRGHSPYVPPFHNKDSPFASPRDSPRSNVF
ncbi:hypothetical protein BCR43DRAFT_481195 [Syncephalastrum racemosum]|uniref:Uncharacterized protein n=1 Tax=Syncephalastrum racemosum TaxID=13706 RepID=A0A1X2HRM8_SYNRA|nr:hypothetical protein BCR43DRAFT_481195 [Syncephalastrum racemosum]